MEDLFGVQLERALRELEPLLDKRRELANTPPLLSQHFLCMRRANNNLFYRQLVSVDRRSKVRNTSMAVMGTRTTHLGTSMCHADFTARVALLCEFASEKLAKLRTEDTIGDKLSLLADCSGHLMLLFYVLLLAC